MRLLLLPSLLCLSLMTRLPAQTLDELVATLAAAESLDDEAIGIAGTKSATFRAYEHLRDQATPADLQKLCDHRSAIVRGYAFRALADREADVDWPALVRARVADTAKVFTFVGCIRSEQMLGDVVVAWARHRKLLSAEQWLDLGEALVRGKSPLLAREWALRNQQFREPMLPALRLLADAGDGPAYIAIARRGAPDDLPRLVRWIARDAAFHDDTAFLAAQHYLLTIPPGTAPEVLRSALLAVEEKAHKQLAEGLADRLRAWLAAVAALQTPIAANRLVHFLRTTTASDGPPRGEIVAMIKAAVDPFPSSAALHPVRAELANLAKR